MATEMKNAPWLGGWAIGAGMGLVAFGVAKVIGGWDYTPAVAVAGVLALLAGLVMGMPWGQTPKAPLVADDIVPPARPMLEAVVTPAVVVAAPVMAAAAAPVAFMSAPAPVAQPKAAPRAKAPAKAPAKAASKPKAAPKPKVYDGPERLKAPRKGRADDLKEIEGIGPAMEKLVNGMGFFHFDQLAAWTDQDVAWVDGNMTSFKGRITRDKWIAQAKIIVTEGLDAFRERAKTNNY